MEEIFDPVIVKKLDAVNRFKRFHQWKKSMRYFVLFSVPLILCFSLIDLKAMTLVPNFRDMSTSRGKEETMSRICATSHENHCQKNTQFICRFYDAFQVGVDSPHRSVIVLVLSVYSMEGYDTVPDP